MRIDATGKNEFACCIYFFVGFYRQVFSNGLYRFTIDKNISDIIVCSCDDPSVFDNNRHKSKL